jgi:hypothetical protein
MKNTRLYLILLALMALTPTAWAQGLSGSGTTDDPYLITSADDWNTFAQSVTNGTTYAGQFVKLTADITASVMAGSHTSESNYHAFSGTFDGDGHTITLALSGSGEGTALFSDLEGATLKNLKAQGSVTTNDRRPATFAVIVFGNSTIKNCWSTVAVSSTRASGWVDGGGFVGRVSSNATLNMIDCAFHGSVTFTNGATTGGGMVGYTQDNATVNLTNCLYSPTSLTLNVYDYNPRVFVSGYVAGNLINCYYNAVAAASVLGKQGTDASNMTNEALAAALGEGWHVYNGMVVPFTGKYYINSAAEWNAFATAVNNGTSFSGQTMALTTDIPTAEEIANGTNAVTTMAGTDSHPFCGTLDGDGHSITLALSGNGPGTALFYLIEGATLKNLKVQGSVATTGYRPATFAAFVEGNSTISNCWSTVAVSSTKTSSWVDGGGFVGRVSGTASLNMTGCAFHGSVTFEPSATTGGGMVGYTQNGATVNLTNCLYSPSALTLSVNAYNPRVFVSGDVAGNLTNCYYNDVAAAATALGKDGKQMRSIAGDANVTVAFSGQATTYDMSGISAYSVGLVYDSTLYAGQCDTVSLNLACTTPPGYIFSGFSASAGTLTGTANPYTLTMPNANVTLQAIIESLSSVNYIDGDSVVHTCSNFTMLTGNETTLEAGWYVVYDSIAYDHALTLNGDVNLILCNGKTMTVTPSSGSGIDGLMSNLTLYSQSLDSIVAGTLNVMGDGSNTAIDIFNATYTQHSGNVVVTNSYGDALYADNITINGGSINANGESYGINAGDLTINGGSINANGGYKGIYATNLTINGGTVIANSNSNSGDYAGLSIDGNLVINGGKVEASSIWAWNNITLGWTNTDDYIFAGSYETEEGTLSVKSGQAFYCEEDENVIVSGTLDGDQIDAIRGKTLRPYFIDYMDGDGEMHICKDFTVLTGDETTLETGWYAVKNDLTYNHTLTLNGDVTLILCDSTTMTVTADNGGGIVGDNIMTIYGQSLDSIAAGTLNVTNNDWQFAAIHPSNYIQHSGNVVASNSDGEALYANYITMNGGNITASGSSFGIKADFDMNLNGGTIIVNNNNTAQAPTNLVVTPAANNVLSATVSWTNPSKTLNNSNLTNIDQIVVCRNNEIIYTEDNVTPGANMTITDDRVPRFDAFQYSVYAVCNGAHGKIIYLDNIAFGPTCGWTINVTQASFQGFRGGKIHVYNAAGTDIAQITTTNSTAQTIPVDMPVGRVSFGWSAPTQSGSFTMAFTIMDSQNNTVYTYSGSSDQLAEGIFCETNNGCGNSAGDGVPTNVVALVDEENPNNINVSWDPIRPDGYGYTVYRDGMLYRLIPNDTSFVDENASLGGHCYVVGFLGDGGENGLYSNESCATSGECYAPRNLDYEYTGSTNKIKLLWERPEPHDGLSGYYLYRKTDGTDYNRIKLLGANATSYTDNTANIDSTWYYYKLYACYNNLECISAPANWIHDENQFFLHVLYSVNGINKQENSRVSLYPNPAKDMFTLEGEGLQHVTVYNLMGQMVYEMECQGESVDINDGTIIANYNRNQGNSYSGLSINGNLVINGGKVEAFSIWAQNDITFGWTCPNDYILAGSYEAVEGTVTVKTGQAFYYGNNVIVSGTLDEDQINAIGGKTLRPYIVPTTVTKDIAGYGTGDGGWQLIALPLQGAFHPTSINNMIADTAAHYDLYRFEPSHEGNEWENYKADSTFKLETGKGYLYANADNVTLTFSGPSYIGDSCEIALVYDSTDYQKCWNLVGNPFDCNATLNREYYVLDESGLGINPEPIPATTPIPPCTAVFVKAVAEGDKAVFTRVTQ